MGTGIHFILLNLQEHTGEDFVLLNKEIQLELSFQSINFGKTA